MTWVDYYKDRVCNLDYDKAFINKYGKFLEEIILKIKTLADPEITSVTLKEEGCGIGSISRSISKMEPYWLKSLRMQSEDRWQDVGKIIFSDVDSEMLRLCQRNTKKVSMGEYLDRVPSFYSREDIISPKYYEPNTIIVTHGVLEHFDDNTIEAILKTYDDENVLFQAHYVPTAKYESPSFGDERLLPVEHWIGLVNPDYYIVDNNGCDLYMFKHKNN